MDLELFQEKALEPKFMSDDEVSSIVRDEIANAYGGENDENNNIQLASNYFHSQPLGNEIEGRSQVVDSTVSDSIEAVMAQIMPIFANSNLVEFDSVHPQDVMQARMETVACNHIIMEANNGYKVFQDAIHNALLYKNGVIKIEFVEVLDVTTEEHTGLSVFQYKMLAQPTAQDQEVEVISEIVHQDGPNLLFDVVLNRKTKVEKLQPRAIQAGHFLFSGDQDDVCLTDCTFTADISYPRRYELLEAGYDEDVVMDLPATTYRVSTREDSPGGGSNSKETEQVKVYNCTLRIDYDLDGYAELRNIVVAGDKATILENSPAKMVPYAAGSPFPVPGQFYGLSFFDKLKNIQDQKTTTQRQYQDNLNANNNRRLAVDIKGIADPNSLLDSKPASVIKCKRSPNDVIMAVPVDDIGPSCIQALDYADRQRSEKVGASLDMQTQQMQVNNDTAHGAERMISAKEEMAAYILSNLFNTLVRNTYLLTHAKLREMNSQMSFSQGGEMQMSQTGQWIPRDRLRIDVGMSKGMKALRNQELQSLLGIQSTLEQAGKTGILVDDTKVYNTLTEIVNNSSSGAVENYFINPQSQQAQQTKQQIGQMQQQMQQKQEAMEQAQMQLQTALAQAELLKAQNGQMKNEIDTLKAIIDKNKQDDQLTFDYDKLYEDNATELAIAGVSAETQNTARETISEN